jgi:hypothetical protein
MPLTAAMARFADVADVVKSRADADEALLEPCDDSRVARQTLIRIAREGQRPTRKVADYISLDDQITRYLLGAGRQADNRAWLPGRVRGCVTVAVHQRVSG